jgi:hypothetical protein
MNKLSLKKSKKFNVIYEPITKVIVKSADDRVVIGRITESGISPIDEETIQICMAYNFPYDGMDKSAKIAMDIYELKQELSNHPNINRKLSSISSTNTTEGHVCSLCSEELKYDESIYLLNNQHSCHKLCLIVLCISA